MATKDKHPPLDPKRHSTNKRVSVGAANTTGARTAKATVTPQMQKKAAALSLANANADRRDKLAAKVGAEIKAGRGAVGLKGANRISYMNRKFPKGGMV